MLKFCFTKRHVVGNTSCATLYVALKFGEIGKGKFVTVHVTGLIRVDNAHLAVNQFPGSFLMHLSVFLQTSILHLIYV